MTENNIKSDNYKDLLYDLESYIIELSYESDDCMLESDAYCVDILTQVSAINAALNAFNKELLANHIHTCVVNDIKQGNEGTVDELCETLKKLMK